MRRFAFERVLAAAAAGVCLGLTLVLWVVISQQQAIWPLPGLYLLEMAAVSLAGLWGIWRADSAGSLTAWAAAGATLGFAILAGFSVGLFYMPVVGLLGLAALWQDRQVWQRLPLHLGLALAALVAQAALILVLVRILNPGAQF
jgi:hypothetical protein